MTLNCRLPKVRPTTVLFAKKIANKILVTIVQSIDLVGLLAALLLLVRHQKT